MRRFLILAMLATPSLAFAQAAQIQSSPQAQIEALSQDLIKATGSAVDYHAQVIQLQNEVTSLNKQMATMQPKPTEPTAPPKAEPAK